jgi:hypothetical protein
VVVVVVVVVVVERCLPLRRYRSTYERLREGMHAMVAHTPAAAT